MKLLVITLPLTLAASLAWGGTILNTTNNLNPLIAPAATSETIVQLAGMKVVFNFGTGLRRRDDRRTGTPDPSSAALYGRVLKASSHEGLDVLHEFSSADATTCGPT